MKRTVEQIVKFRLIESNTEDELAWCGDDGQYRRWLLSIEYAEEIPRDYFEVSQPSTYVNGRKLKTLQDDFNTVAIIEKIGLAVVDALNANRRDDRIRASFFSQLRGQHCEDINACVIVYFTEAIDDENGEMIPDDDELDEAIDLAKAALHRVSEIVAERVDLWTEEREQIEKLREPRDQEDYERDCAHLADLLSDYRCGSGIFGPRA